MRQLKILKQTTYRNDIIDRYFKEINNIEMINQKEEVELARKIRSGDKKAEKKLIKANLRFVVSVAKQYNQADPNLLSELISEGNIGLIEAAKRFDETRGFKFISYAVWWIRQAILQYIDNTSYILKTPANTPNKIQKINKFINQFLTNNGRYPEIFEISEELNIPEFRIQEMLNVKNITHGDSTIKEDDSYSIFDNLKSFDNILEDNINNKHIKQKLIDAIEFTLDEKSKIIIYSYFGINRTELSLREIGEELDITKERVRQIKEKALRKIKIYLNRKK